MGSRPDGTKVLRDGGPTVWRSNGMEVQRDGDPTGWRSNKMEVQRDGGPIRQCDSCGALLHTGTCLPLVTQSLPFDPSRGGRSEKQCPPQRAVQGRRATLDCCSSARDHNGGHLLF
eukprot:353551-Chlamydomonas_euryale.AAC.2